MALMKRPLGQAAQVGMAEPYKQTARRLRSPQHSFNLRARPFQIQPFFIAPVLPGETLKNLQVQARIVSDPIKNSIIGWWTEHHFFYCKHRDLPGSTDFQAMQLDPDYDLSTYKIAADPEFYHGASMVSWARQCYIAVVENYFRDEGENWNTYTIGNMAAAQIKQETWLNSALLDDNYIVDMPPNVDLDASGTITADEVQRAMRMWMLQQSHNLTDMTYEDFLATYGIRQEQAAINRPELVRSLMEWTYPTNTIDPTDGSAASAVSWAIRGSADKDRFFREPGFLFGVQVTRPKVYLRNVDGSAVGALDSALAWLPAIMADDPRTSLKKESATTGPLQTLVTDAGGYWFDVKDLFVYGDQFLNYALSATDANIVDLPAAASLANKRYPDSDDVDALFAAASPANKIKSDGLVSLNIMGRVWDTTPGTTA